MTGNRRGKAGSGATKTPLAERGDDFYATPIEAMRALIVAEQQYMPRDIWEPACGDGAIVLPLREAGYNVVATDLVERGCPDSTARVDFLMEQSAPASAIITNPPYKLATEFVEKALQFQTTTYVALLLRLGFLEGIERKALFESSPIARVHISSRRLPRMHREGWDGKEAGNQICFAWFVWDRSHQGAPKIHWFDYRQLAADNDNLRSAA